MLSSLKHSPLWQGFFFAIIFIFIFLTGAQTGLFILNRNTSKTTEYPQTKIEKDMTIILNAVDFREIENPTEEGFEYVVVDVTFENNQSAAVFVLPTLQMYMQNEAGQTYYMIPVPKINAITAGQLEVNDKRRGEVGFAVPQNAQSLKLVIDTGWNNTEPISFEISH